MSLCLWLQDSWTGLFWLLVSSEVKSCLRSWILLTLLSALGRSRNFTFAVNSCKQTLWRSTWSSQWSPKRLKICCPPVPIRRRHDEIHDVAAHLTETSKKISNPSSFLTCLLEGGKNLDPEGKTAPIWCWHKEPQVVLATPAAEGSVHSEGLLPH